MKNSKLIWIFIVGVIVTVFVALNYQTDDDTIPLSEIFPEDDAYPVDIEYEFVDEEGSVENVTTEFSSETEKAIEKILSEDETVAKAAEEKAVEQVVDAAPAQVEEVAKTVTQESETATVNVFSEDQMKEVPFTIQVASFRDQQKAKTALSNIQKKNADAYIGSRDLGSKGTWYRVYIGKYDSRAQANSALSKIKADFKDSFIIAPQKKQ